MCWFFYHIIPKLNVIKEEKMINDVQPSLFLGNIITTTATTVFLYY